MDAALVAAIVLAAVFAATNGLHDASNAIATLVATRAARPGQAIVLAAVFNLVGPFLVGGAVADTIGGIVTVSPSAAVAVIGSGLAAAVTWNLVTWRLGLPSSSGHALVGGFVGAGLVEGGADAINWGGIESGHPVGVFGTLIALAISPPLGALGAFLVIRLIRLLARHATRRWNAPVNAGQWGMSAALAFSHGANDAQKSVGVIAALLLAEGQIDSLEGPNWAKLLCALALTAGHSPGRMAHHSHRGPPHLPDPADRRALEPERVGRGDLRCLAGRGAGVDHPGRGVLGGGRRRRPGPLASRALGDRSPHGPRVGHHDSRDRRRSPWPSTSSWSCSREAPALVPPRVSPTCSGSFAARPPSRSRALDALGGVERG